jgi:hypothetical protein
MDVAFLCSCLSDVVVVDVVLLDELDLELESLSTTDGFLSKGLKPRLSEPEELEPEVISPEGTELSSSFKTGSAVFYLKRIEVHPPVCLCGLSRCALRLFSFSSSKMMFVAC